MGKTKKKRTKSFSESEVNETMTGKPDDYKEKHEKSRKNKEGMKASLEEREDDDENRSVISEEFLTVQTNDGNNDNDSGTSDETDDEDVEIMQKKQKELEEMAKRLKQKIDSKKAASCAMAFSKETSYKVKSKIMPLTIIDKFPETTYEEGRVKWPNWRDLFYTVLEANPHIETQNEKRAALLLRGGATIFKIHQSEKHSPDEINDVNSNKEIPVFDNLIKRSNYYFKQYAHEAIDLQNFDEAKQKKNETFMSFLDRLKKLGQLCGIKESDLSFKMRIVRGAIHSKELYNQGVLLDSDLHTIIGVAMRIEASEKSKQDQLDDDKRSGEILASLNQQKWNRSFGQSNHSDGFRGSFRTAYVARGGYRGNRGRSVPYNSWRNNIARCGKCGKAHEQSSTCPAEGKKCNKCAKFNHFASCCRTEVKKESSSHVISSMRTEDEAEVNCMIKYSVGGTIINGEIDSGSPINTLTEADFENIIRDRNNGTTKIFDEVNGNCKTVTAYASSKPLAITTTFKAWVKIVNGNKPDNFAEFFVVKGAYKALLGKFTASSMKLLRVGLKVNALSHDEIKEFPSVPDLEVKLDVDNSVKLPMILHYRQPVAYKEAARERLKLMTAQGIIHPAKQPIKCCSRMELVPKGPEDFRIVFDLREVNKAVMRSPFPLPVIDDYMDLLQGAKWFAKIDLTNAFHHLKLAEASTYLTTFMTDEGPMEFTRLPFGLNAAPEIFQRTMMSKIAIGIDGLIVLMDDFLVFAKTRDELKQRRNKLICRLRENNLTRNEKKCVDETQEIEFLGYKMNKDGITPADDKIKAVKNFRKPENEDEIKSFLGLLTFVHSFIPDFAVRAEPLRKLTRMGASWEWTESQENAFKSLKSAICDNVITRGYFDKKAKTKLYSDACPIGYGAVLTQTRENGEEQIIACAAKTTSGPEKNYSQTHLEAGAAVWAVEKFYYWLLGHPFTLLVDHEALKYLYNGKHRDCKRAISRAESWALRLSNYQFDVVYIKGKSNIADVLSRLCTGKDEPYKGRDEDSEWNNVTLNIAALYENDEIINLEQIREQIRIDPEMKALEKAIETSHWIEDLKPYEPFKNELFVHKGLIFRDSRLILPKELRSKAIEISHKGHPGIVTMKRMLRSKLWWPKLDSEIEDYAKKCFNCTLVAPDYPMEPMIRTELPKQPWDYIGADFYSAGCIPGKVLVITDYYSRYLICVYMEKTDAESVINVFEKIFREKGFPGALKIDNGPPFRSHEFMGYFEKIGVKLYHSIPLHPRQNGQTERAMPGLTRAITTGKQDGNGWKKSISDYVAAYNSRPHKVTNKNPEDVFNGRVVRRALPSWNEEVFSDEEMRDNDKISKFKGKQYQDKRNRAKQTEINEGDTVLIHNQQKGKTVARFHEAKYKVIKREGGKLYLLGENGVKTERYVAQVRKVFGDENKEDDINWEEEMEIEPASAATSGEELLQQSQRSKDDLNEPPQEARKSKRVPRKRIRYSPTAFLTQLSTKD